MDNAIRSMFILSFFLIGGIGYSQITVTNTQTPEELVSDVLVGAGVEISNVEFNHSIPLAGVVQAQAGFFDASGMDFPIPSGVILATGNVRLAEGPNDSGSATDNEGVAVDPNDADLDAIGTTTINNEAVLEFDFVPSGDSVVFKYVFASEEYHEFSTSSFNDVFGFFISGPGFAGPYEDGAENIAIIPGTALPVSMNNLNNGSSNTGPCVNCEFLVDNTGGTEIQYDAHTVVMYARASVECGETYHIKMAIGDAGDMSYDSGVFLEASSFSSNGVEVEIASVLGEDALIEGCDSALVTFIRPVGSDTVDLTVDFEIGGTATNGVDYGELDDFVFFPEGEDTVTVWIVPEDDGVIEGPETVTITVEIINECGDTILTEATIEIIDPYDISVFTDDIFIECAEDSLMLTFETDGVPELEIEWSSGGTEIEEWVPGDIIGTTIYTVEVTDVCGETATGEIEVTLDPASDMYLTFNQDLFVICPEEEIFIDATVHDPYDEDELTFEWDPTGDETEDITTEAIAEGWYYLSVYDGCFTVKDSVKIEFGEVDLEGITVIDAVDCPGIADPTLGSIIVAPDDPTWSYELVGYEGPVPSGVFDDLAGGIDYILVITDEDGCTMDTIVPVGLGENAVLATWEVDSLRDVTCFGDMDGGAYIFDINGGIEPPYDVIWTNIGGVYDTDTDVPVDGDSEIDNLNGGTWTVTVIDQEGCAWSHSFEIFEPEELTMELIHNEPTCFGFSDGSITVNTEGGNGGETYVMTDADGVQLNVENSNTINTLKAGTYFITVTDKNGCTISESFTLGQPDELDIEFTVNQPLCYGIETGYVEVDTVFNYTGAYDQIGYYWAPNPSGFNGIGAYFTNHLGDGDYTLTINDENGCSKTFDFTIQSPPELKFSEIGHFPAYCRVYGYQSGNGEVFAAATGGTPDYTTPKWTYLEDGTTVEQGTWGGRNPGDYVVVIEDGNGCILTDTVKVDSLNPIADFTINSDQLNNDLKGTAPVDVTFTNTSLYFANPKNPLADTTFQWNLDSPFNDWFFSYDYFETFDTTYEARGESYLVDVCLIAQNKNGCADTTCKTIEIFEPIKITPVNVFSPDGDGINDIFTFQFSSASISEFNCVIVNRWGVVVGEINDIGNGWDGTDKSGSPCKDGTYFYNYTAISDDGTKLEGQGNLYILTKK
ncbi:choice-of-anchor L domain-containing protein [Crocinitomix algicola]|uniref:choice-of-anchor L domain-containing protein n=1 Tax=Crocinitomix algicola TaxID=1740263 RepID=UPI000872A967|nr:choice-of-anchor L domain-containing protein [Crocinitomix algicola]